MDAYGICLALRSQSFRRQWLVWRFPEMVIAVSGAMHGGLGSLAVCRNVEPRHSVARRLRLSGNGRSLADQFY